MTVASENQINNDRPTHAPVAAASLTSPPPIAPPRHGRYNTTTRMAAATMPDRNARIPPSNPRIPSPVNNTVAATALGIRRHRRSQTTAHASPSASGTRYGTDMLIEGRY